MPYPTNYVSCTKPAVGESTGLKNIRKALNACQIDGIRYPLQSGFVVRNIAGSSNFSVHSCGRALDIMVSSKSGGDVMAVALEAVAADIGLQEIIWYGRRWTAASGWLNYSGSNPHRDHVHFSINPASALNITYGEAYTALSPQLCGGLAHGMVPGATNTGSPLPPSSNLIAELSASTCNTVLVAGTVVSINRTNYTYPVTIYADGVVVQTVSTVSPTGLFSLILRNLQAGSHTITATADLSLIGQGTSVPVGSPVTVTVAECLPPIDGSTPPLVLAKYPLNATLDEIKELTQCDQRLGCGEYSVAILNMGGQTRYCIPQTVLSIAYNRVLDDLSSATATFAHATCGSCFDSVNPWQHELAIYRNQDLVWVGPISNIYYDIAEDRVTVEANDLSAWLDQRMIPRDTQNDYYGECIDLSNHFEAVVSMGMVPDPRPNMRLFLQPTGISGTREYPAQQFRYAGDELRELARSGVDYTVLQRYMIAGNVEIPGSDIPLVIDDHWVKPPRISVLGHDMATRILVGAGASGADGYEIYGVYPDGPLESALLTNPVETLGLIERAYDETAIEDVCTNEDGQDYQVSINQAAKTRWDFMSEPHAVVEGGQLSESAPFGMMCLLPGRRIRVSLSTEYVGRKIVDLYRIQSVNVTAGASSTEVVAVTLTPLGTYEGERTLR